jgi:hypothetical protein
MKIKTLVAASLLVFGLTNAANAVELQDNHPDVYVVKSGDTLWDISETFLKSPWKWPEIWHVNQQINNPHLIFPGDVLKLVYLDGRPVLMLGDGKLSPRIREMDADEAIATIPLTAIQPFMTGAQVVTEEEYDEAPYLVGSREDRVIFATNDTVYGTGFSEEQLLLKSFSVFDKGEAYIHPETGENLGFEAKHMGTVKLERKTTPPTFRISEVKYEIRPGHRLLPAHDEHTRPFFQPHAPADQLEGYILSVPDGVTQIGQYMVVVVSLGKRDNLEPGHVLEIWQAGKRVVDPVATEKSGKGNVFTRIGEAFTGKTKKSILLPDEKAGQLIV